MKCIRFILAMMLGSFSLLSQAQITAYINGKEIKSGATVNKNDLASLEVSFKNPKLPSFIYGKTSLGVQIDDAKNKNVDFWSVRKDGSSAVEDFLKNTSPKKKFKAFTNSDLLERGNTLDWVLKSSYGKEDCRNLTVKITLTYNEQTGYQEYAQAIYLLENFTFTVPLFETKNTYLPFLDLTLDKTNIPGDLDLHQNGRLGDKGTELGYRFKDKNGNFYSIYALSSKDYPGLNAKELADDFIHAAALYAAQDYVTKFSNYDIGKYTVPWDDINNLLSERRRIPSLSWKGNKEIKKMDLLTLYTPVDINGMKGYTFKADEELRSDRNSKWQPGGNFVIYIVNHPTNPDLTLVTSISLYNDVKNTDEIDTFLKGVLNGIKK